MDWMAIGTALMLGAMLFLLFPRVLHAVKNSPKGSMSDWMGFIIPIAAIIGFVILLINMV